jgi:hypothetical protein
MVVKHQGIMKTKLKMSTPMILLFTALSLFLLFGGGCTKDELLSLQRTNFTGTNLRLDGFFYFQYGQVGNEYTDVLFLYRNGIVFYEGIIREYDLVLVEQSLLSENRAPTAQRGKSSWGVFLVDGDIIKLERRYNAWGRPYQSFIREGVILNDTTLRIMKSYRSFGTPDVQSMDRIYHFRSFSPKPDSTNVYIK